MRCKPRPPCDCDLAPQDSALTISRFPPVPFNTCICILQAILLWVPLFIPSLIRLETLPYLCPFLCQQKHNFEPSQQNLIYILPPAWKPLKLKQPRVVFSDKLKHLRKTGDMSDSPFQTQGLKSACCLLNVCLHQTQHRAIAHPKWSLLPLDHPKWRRGFLNDLMGIHP